MNQTWPPDSLWQPLDPRFPWIEIIRYRNNTSQMHDKRTGHQERVIGPAGVADFVARHSSAQGHGGLGDLVRGITKFFGMSSCEPCAKRQAAMNRAAPRVFRR